MKIAALILLTAAATSGARADVVGYVQTPQGRIEVHDDRGPCAGDAKRADFVAANGDRVSGCWVIRGAVVAVVFLDGDVAQVPVMHLQKPTPA
ncbi:MAG TPA: hypothetical protein VK570_02300 [Rubrivivax sp.]|nr:hypothetical protein [Rubrivivax sp.]